MDSFFPGKPDFPLCEVTSLPCGYPASPFRQFCDPDQQFSPHRKSDRDPRKSVIDFDKITDRDQQKR
jgi:hypothetical protein